MILMTTIDDSGGLLFNHRRQSQDRLLRQHMLDIAGPSGLWMDGYTAALFAGQEDRIHVSETFLEEAGPGACALLEDRPAAPFWPKSKNCTCTTGTGPTPAIRSSTST